MSPDLVNKARRGELKLRLSAGFVYTPDDRIVRDPDQQVRESIHLLFGTFRRVGSAHPTVSYFRDQGLKFPLRPHSGPHKGESLLPVSGV